MMIAYLANITYTYIQYIFMYIQTFGQKEIIYIRTYKYVSSVLAALNISASSHPLYYTVFHMYQAMHNPVESMNDFCTCMNELY